MKNVVGADNERAGAQLDKGCEGRVEIALGAGMQNMELQPEGARRRLRASRESGSAIAGFAGLTRGARWWPMGSSSCSNSSRFAATSRFRARHAGDVAARPVEAGDKAKLTGSAAGPKTIGIVVVAALAASAEAVPPAATITAT